MPKTEAKRKADNKYDLKTYTIVACKIKKSRAEEFKKACEAAGTTPNAVFKDAIDRFMGDRNEETPIEEPTREPFEESP